MPMHLRSADGGRFLNVNAAALNLYWLWNATRRFASARPHLRPAVRETAATVPRQESPRST